MSKLSLDTAKEMETSGDINVNEYRSHYKAAFGKDTTLTNAQIVKMVADSEDDYDPADWAKEMQRLEGGDDETPITIGANTTVGNLAAELASKVDAEIEAEISEFLDAKDKVGRGALELMFIMASKYGKEGMNSFPVPGSKDGNNPDKFETTRVNAKGERVKATGSFYDVFFARTSMGLALEKKKAGLELAKKQDPKMPAEYVSMNAAELGVEYNAVNNRMTLAKGNYKRAINIWLQMVAIKSLRVEVDGKSVPSVKVEIAKYMDKSGNERIKPGNTPIMILDNSNAPVSWSNWKAVSVPTFLSYDVESIGEEQTFEKLVLSNKRGTSDSDEEAAGTAEPQIKNLTALDGTFSETLAFLANDKNLTQIWAKLNGKNEEDKKHWVQLIGNMVIALDPFWPKIKDTYQRYEIEEAEQLRKKALEREVAV